MLDMVTSSNIGKHENGQNALLSPDVLINGRFRLWMSHSINPFHHACLRSPVLHQSPEQNITISLRWVHTIRDHAPDSQQQNHKPKYIFKISNQTTTQFGLGHNLNISAVTPSVGGLIGVDVEIYIDDTTCLHFSQISLERLHNPTIVPYTAKG